MRKALPGVQETDIHVKNLWWLENSKSKFSLRDNKYYSICIPLRKYSTCLSNICKVLKRSNKRCKRSWLQKVCTINQHLVSTLAGIYICSRPCQVVKKQQSVPIFDMYLFNISMTYLQDIETFRSNLCSSETSWIFPANVPEQ